MKLSRYADELGISYRTAWKWFKEGKIKGAYKTESGTIIIPEKAMEKADYVITYARVSSSENKKNLETQSERLQDFCIANGWIIKENITEIGSGINDKRKKLERILNNDEITKIVVEHKDRLTRFGFNYLQVLLEKRGCEIIVINVADGDKNDLMQDLISIITSFTARYYGLRRSKRKTEKIIEELQNGTDQAE